MIDVTRIGRIDHGIDGSDEYLLVRDTEEDLTPERAIEWLMPKYYRETRAPAGDYFCNTIRAVQAQYRENTCICTVEHRYDV